MFVDFYFTPYITTKHNNNNGMRHETVRVDHTIDSTFHQNGSDGKRSSSSSYGRKERHQSHFPPPFCFVSLLLSFFIFVFYFVTGEGYHATIIDQNEGINSIPQCDAIVVAGAAAAPTYAIEQQHTRSNGATRVTGYRPWSGNRIDTAAWYKISLGYRIRQQQQQ